MTDTAKDRVRKAKAPNSGGAPHVMPRCPACGQPEQLVWVHGHGQCAHCHMNVMPCCDGEVCETD
jgi:hypothetical protein